MLICGDAGIGRQASLRCLCQYWRVGSSPISRTSVKDIRFSSVLYFCFAKTYALQYAEKLWQFHCCHSFQFIEKVCFFKKVLILYPFKNALWALRPCKAFGRSISASLPKPQTPFPGKGAECGAAALTKQGRLKSVAHSRCTMQRHQRLTARIGATPQTPF